jgi:hypothetical protein
MLNPKGFKTIYMYVHTLIMSRFRRSCAVRRAKRTMTKTLETIVFRTVCTPWTLLISKANLPCGWALKTVVYTCTIRWTTSASNGTKWKSNTAPQCIVSCECSTMWMNNRYKTSTFIITFFCSKKKKNYGFLVFFPNFSIVQKIFYSLV